MIRLCDVNYHHRKLILIGIAVLIKMDWVIGGTELHFTSRMAVQLEFTSAELRCRDLYLKLAEAGMSPAESARTVKAEEEGTDKERSS